MRLEPRLILDRKLCGDECFDLLSFQACIHGLLSLVRLQHSDFQPDPILSSCRLSPKTVGGQAVQNGFVSQFRIEDTLVMVSGFPQGS